MNPWRPLDSYESKMATVVGICRNGSAVARGAAVLSSTVTGSARNGCERMIGPADSPLVKGTQNEERWRAYLDGIRSGNSESLARLYDETSGILYGLALRVLNDPADAEEVVLDVYQHVWKSTHTFDASRGSVWGWLTMMTRSRAIDKLRRGGVRRTRELPLESGWEAPSGSPMPDSESIFAQERKLVRQALGTLAAEQREAIELAFFRGLTHVEVADSLSMPLGTIKTRIRIGMRKLREALAPLAYREGNN
jgi:RNA polymerase sigma-70 factor, ECF subfamily